jgi:hypothetical protein
LSRDKNISLSLCPRTRAGAKIPRQTFMSWDVPEKKQEKYVLKQEIMQKIVIVLSRVLSHPGF